MSSSKQQKSFVVKGRSLFSPDSSGKLKKVGAAIGVTAFGNIRGSQSGSFAEIKLVDYDGKPRRIHVPRREFVKAQSIATVLLDSGYVLPEDNDLRKELLSGLCKAKPTGRRLIVTSPGWEAGRFALGNVIVGEKREDALKLVYNQPDGSPKPKFRKRGTLQQWKDGVAIPATGSNTIIYCICMALAAPLLELCGEEGGGVHLVAPSSKGKTLALLAARSVSGEATRKDLTGWRATSNALEGVAFAHNGTLLCIDDTDQLPGDEKDQARTVRECTHTLANGHGKLRLSAFGRGVQVELTWKILVLSNGVKALADIVKEGGAARLGSEEVRLIDLPCLVAEETGVFETLPASATSLESAIRQIEDACKTSYGTPLRRFLRKLVAKPKGSKAEVQKLMQHFMEAALVTASDAWEQRFAKKFAIAYAAGVLAARWKILPWSAQRIEAAIRECYRRARAAVPTSEELQLTGLTRLKKLAKDPAKAVRLYKLKGAKKSNLKLAPGQAVVDKNDKHGLHLIIPPKRFEKWMRSPRVAQLTLQALDRDGRLLRTEKRVPTCQRQFPWVRKRRRYYFISLKPTQAKE